MLRGTITFCFDDGYLNVWQQVLPGLEKRNIPGVFAIPMTDASQLDDQPIASWQTWLDSISRSRVGHEIAAHTVNHVDLTSMSGRQLDAELSRPAKELTATTLVYPGGAHDDAVIKAASKYFQAGRGVLPGYAKLPPSDQMRLPTFNYTKSNWSLLKANARVLRAWLTNVWLIETYHLVSDLPTAYSHQVPQREFERHLDFVAMLPIRVTTIKGALMNNG